MASTVRFSKSLLWLETELKLIFILNRFFVTDDDRILLDPPFDEQIADHAEAEERRDDAKLCVNANPVPVNVRNDEAQTLPQAVVGEGSGLLVWKDDSVQS